MGHRDAPTEPHPAPAPDWILGSDGHWKPPPFLDSVPKRARSTTVVDAEAPPVSHKVGAGTIIAVILVIVAIAFLAKVALFA